LLKAGVSIDDDDDDDSNTNDFRFNSVLLHDGFIDDDRPE